MQGLWFDARYVNPAHPDGITRFSLELIRALCDTTELTVIVDRPEKKSSLPEHPNLKVVEVNPLISLRELTLAKKLNAMGCKVFFSPMQTTLMLGRKFKLVSTLHDLIYYRHRNPPGQFNFAIRIIWVLYHLSYWPQRWMLNRADAVATVSETTEEQMLEARLTKRPIRVIHNAALWPERSGNQKRHGSRTLIYMGSFIDYKNVETLIRGMAELPDHELLMLSRISDERKEELSQLAREMNANVKFLSGVTDQEYEELLFSAKALVTASLDEGFGIPVVEAMSHGCPVVVSDIAIFEEVAGPAGLRFSPENPSEFAAQVRRLDDPQVWQLQSKLGVDQAKFFTWDDSAELLLELAEDLVSEWPGSPGI